MPSADSLEVFINTAAGEVQVAPADGVAGVTASDSALEVTIPVNLGALGSEISVRVSRQTLMAMIPDGWVSPR